MILHERGWEIDEVALDGKRTVLARGDDPPSNGPVADEIEVKQKTDGLFVTVNKRSVYEGRDMARTGSIGFLAQNRSALHVDRLLISTLGNPCRKFLLPTDAIQNAGALPDVWKRENQLVFKYGFGYSSTTPGATAKWSYYGKGFRLWAPRKPGLGSVEVYLDGRLIAEVDLSETGVMPSAVVCAQSPLARGYHAVTVVQQRGEVVCDCLEVEI